VHLRTQHRDVTHSRAVVRGLPRGRDDERCQQSNHEDGERRYDSAKRVHFTRAFAAAQSEWNALLPLDTADATAPLGEAQVAWKWRSVAVTLASLKMKPPTNVV
jgi:hypothetical protein